MNLDFPEEKPSTERTSEDVLTLPPVMATLVQLEEVNRILTASVMALLQMIGRREMNFYDQEQLLEIFEQFKQRSLQSLDRELIARLTVVAGSDPQAQAQYLQRHPEGILFSGAYLKPETSPISGSRKESSHGPESAAPG